MDTGISMYLCTFTSTLQDSWEMGLKERMLFLGEREPDKASGSPAPSQVLGGHDGAQGEQDRWPLIPSWGQPCIIPSTNSQQQLSTKCYIFKGDQQKIMGFFFFLCSLQFYSVPD